MLGGDSCSEDVENWKGMKDTCSELFSVSLIRHITLGGGNARWKDRQKLLPNPPERPEASAGCTGRKPRREEAVLHVISCESDPVLCVQVNRAAEPGVEAEQKRSTPSGHQPHLHARFQQMVY